MAMSYSKWLWPRLLGASLLYLVSPSLVRSMEGSQKFIFVIASTNLNTPSLRSVLVSFQSMMRAKWGTRITFHTKNIDIARLAESASRNSSNAWLLVSTATLTGQGAIDTLTADSVAYGRHTTLGPGIFDNQPVSALQPEREPPPSRPQIKQWMIDPAVFSHQSEIRFRPPNLWASHPWWVLISAITIAFLTVLVAALLVKRHRHAIDIERSRRRLEEIAYLNRNASASIYSAAIAHELHQPLAAIMSHAETAESFLQMESVPRGEIRGILASIRQENRRANELVQRMRSMLKKSEPQIRPIDLNAVAQDVAGFLSVEARMRGTSLKLTLTPGTLMVAADLLQLQQVLVNLVLNSLEAVADLPTARREIAIATSMQDGHYAEVRVIDFGPGFGPHLEQIFAPFFTTKSQGMGLGLTISASIVQSYNGKVTVENVSDGGAVVRFQLPLLKTMTKA